MNVGRLVQGRANARGLHAVRRHRTARPVRHRDRRHAGRRHRPQRHRRQADGAAAAAPQRHRHDLPLADADLPAVAREADILVAALGRPAFVTKDFVKPGATVIDVGTTPMSDRSVIERLFAARLEASRGVRAARTLVLGDVHPSVDRVAGALTPVPGGVGPLTIAMLLKNTVRAAQERLRRRGHRAGSVDAESGADRRNRDGQKLRARAVPPARRAVPRRRRAGARRHGGRHRSDRGDRRAVRRRHARAGRRRRSREARPDRVRRCRGATGSRGDRASGGAIARSRPAFARSS